MVRATGCARVSEVTEGVCRSKIVENLAVVNYDPNNLVCDTGRGRHK
jgi:hypothetical protein